jgi:hypothetical protein
MTAHQIRLSAVPRPSLFNLAVSRINRLPRPLLSSLLRYGLRFAGAGGLRFERLDVLRAVLYLRNHRRLGDHTGDVHDASGEQPVSCHMAWAWEPS